MPTLRGLLGSNKLKAVFTSAAAWNQPVGDREFVKKGEIAGSLKPLVLGRKVPIDGSIGLSVRMLAAGVSAALYRVDDKDEKKVVPPTNHSWALLSISGDLGAAGEETVPITGAGKLTVKAGFDIDADYTHARAVPRRKKRVEVLPALVTNSRLPGRIAIEAIDANTVHRLHGAFQLDLGLTVEAGAHMSIADDLLDGIDSPVKFDIDAGLHASLGLSLREEMDLAVGSVGTRSDGWVRVRLYRSSQRQFTLGAMLSFEVDYDLGSGLIGVLEQVLELRPIPQLMDTFDRLSSVAQKVKNADWGAVKAKLEDDGTEALSDLLGVERILDSPAGRRKLQELVDGIGDLVGKYEGLDEKIQDLWSRVLGKAQIGTDSKFRRALEDIAKLDPSNTAAALETLLGEDARRYVDLFESLSDESLESLVVGGASVGEAVERAGKIAASTVEFLDSVPDGLLKPIRDFSEKRGIAGAMKWLSANATSATALRNKLEQTANKHLRRIVERIAEETIDRIDDDDVERVKAFAGKVDAKLRRVLDFDGRLKEELGKLKGQAGFSVGIEFDRLSRTTALVDIELDPKVGDCRKAFGKLQNGKAKQFLEELPEPDGDDEELPFLIRECVFTSHRSSSLAISALFSWLGMRKTTRRRIVESTIRVEQSGNTVSRRGEHGGSVLVQVTTGATEWLARARLESIGKGRGANIERAYGSVEEQSLVLTVSRDDPKLTRNELLATDKMLLDMGFIGGGELDALGIPDLAPCRVALSVKLDGAAVRSFFSQLPAGSAVRARGLDADFLDAAHCWFHDALVQEQLHIGQRMAEAIRTQKFLDNWKLGTVRNLTIWVNDGHDRVTPGRPPYGAVNSLAVVRGMGERALARAATAQRKVVSTSPRPKPVDLDLLSKRFARAMGRSAPGLWPSPMFVFWFAAVRLSRLSPDPTRKAAGLATLRWKAGDEWADPVSYRLAGGLELPPLPGE